MTEAEGKKLAPGDVIALNDLAGDWTRGHPFKVDAIRIWGVRCYTESESAVAVRTLEGKAYYNAKWSEIAGRGEQQTLTTGAGNYPD